MFDEIFDTQMMIELQGIMKKLNHTITCAESCTGGLCASMITEIAGSSNIFNGSVVTYSNNIKEQELNVKRDTLIKHGAVSFEVVDEMLEGVLKKFDANCAIAISGIAGPDGGTQTKPVGTVVIGIQETNNKSDIEIFHFKGNRKEVQIQAAKTAFLKIFKIYSKKA